MQKLSVASVPDLVRISQRAGISQGAVPHGTKVHYPSSLVGIRLWVARYVRC
jgi:hypothetical protein